MPLTGKTAEEIEELKAKFMENVPKNGSSIGNKALRLQLEWDPEVYFAVKGRLVNDTKISTGRGRGGSVKRIISDVELDDAQVAGENPQADIHEGYPNEEALYDDLISTLKNGWVLDESFDQSIVEKTARGGRRKDGTWKRPDITAAASTSFTFVPGKFLDIVTFEVKHYTGFNVTAVYEALAHKRASTKAYVLLYLPEAHTDEFSDIVDEAKDEAAKHGIGFIIANNPKDYETWEFHEEAVRSEPDPAKLNVFIRKQLTEGSRDQIIRWFR